MPESTTNDEQRPTQSAADLVDFVRDYAKQETLEPLRGWGRYVGFGVAGAAVMALGVVIALLGLLRLLQTEVDAFDGPNSSIYAYLITLVAGVIVIGAVIWQIQRRHSLQRPEPGDEP